jgi:uncharacterized membrane protein
MTDSIHDLNERLSRMEAQVAKLTERLDRMAPEPAPGAPPSAPMSPVAPSPQAVPPRVPPPLRRPAAPPKPPRKPINSIVYIAAAGAGIFLIGAVFFLYWSIEQGWIGPEMRFLLGLVVGGALAAGAAKLTLGDSPKLGVCLLLAGIGTLMFTFRWGAFEYDFYSPTLGLAGTALAVLLAGALAARARLGSALCVALSAGLISPLVFSEGGHHEIALAIYLAVLLSTALAIPYLTQVGARWVVTRWLGFVGTWALLAGAVLNASFEDANTLMILVLLHYVLAGLWIWLPGQKEAKPSTPTILWSLATLATSSLSWVLWKRGDYPEEWFAGPALLMALVNLLLVKPLRIRLECRQADLGLLVLAAGHLALAVPIAMDWQWVGPMWALFALGMAWAVTYAEDHPDWEEDEVRALLLLALGMASIATLRWMVHTVDGLDHSAMPTPLFNRNFAEAAFTCLAWGLLARRGRTSGVISAVALELVANVALSVELGRMVRHFGGTGWAASIVMTLTWAFSGAVQWLMSLSRENRELRLGLAIAGYSWLGIASFKLIVADLAGASTPLRALAFLGVGAIFLTAALVANRFRQKRKEVE